MKLGSNENMEQLIDTMCKLSPYCKDQKDTRIIFCDEFIKTIKKMQGTELEPYLAKMNCIQNEACFEISFKIPLSQHSKSEHLR